MYLRFGLFFSLLFPLIACADICSQIDKVDTARYSAEIGSRTVTFLAIDLKNNHKCWAISKQRLNERHSPYSTFKIPHSLIALESGAVTAIDKTVEWNSSQYPSKPYWPDTWKQPQSLASAFQRSAVWFYQDLVPRIDPKEYKKWLGRFEYGNQKFTPGSNQFWLNNELKISPVEQVNFLVCLLETRCGISEKNVSAFEKISLVERKDGLFLYAKTGAGPIDPDNMDGAFEGWYVGYIKDENADPVIAFALYVKAENFSSLRDFRKILSLKLMNDLGYWRE